MLGYRPNSEETDRALNALSHAGRRRLLFELYEQADAEGERVCYTDIPQFRAQRRRVLLYHSHLPKLEAAGYINWNEAEKTIQKGPQWEEIEPLLELIYTHLYELPPFLQGKPSDNTETQC
ncbi:DUF7344 domain-containing protein [Halorubrum salsamenti]|uniref:DUF7344 domain-containing protein n=1 Tax=Halorubrum salsamenti TaxID=2583990 RepID=UPI0011A33C4F|nr:transcriptional regulator [Halorubrum salsamenti]